MRILRKILSKSRRGRDRVRKMILKNYNQKSIIRTVRRVWRAQVIQMKNYWKL